MLDNIPPWLLSALFGAGTGGAGWVAGRRQRAIGTESSALDLYKDALEVLENVQAELKRMSDAREEMRLALDECIRARNEAALERAKDRVKIAQLEEQEIKRRQQVEKLEADVSRLTNGGK